jgi:glycosyltransferase involved in cell wall biosynthesis
LRVLTYLHSYEPGGLERDVLRFNGAWAALGIDAQIVLGRNEGPLAADAPDVPIHLLQTGQFSTRHFETLWMIWHLPRLVRTLRPDAIFCAGNSYTIVAVALRLILGRRCPPIVFRVSNDLIRRDMPPPIRALYYLWLRLQAPYFAAIVGMAEPVRGEIVTQMRADPDRVTIIDNGSLTKDDIDRFARSRRIAVRNHQGRHYLAVGRLAPQKNFPLLVDAFARIARPADRLTIVGEGGERDRLERQIAAHGLTGHIELAGHQPQIDAWLAAADALVLSSDYEGLGIVVIEALAAGLPVVATDCSPNIALLLDGVGRRVPVGDSVALAEAMAAVVGEPVRVDAMRRRAEQFTVEASSNDWQALFEKLTRTGA